MVLSRIIKRKKEVENSNEEAKKASLTTLFHEGVPLPEKVEEKLKLIAEKGLNFFRVSNQSRLKLAFSTLNPLQKKAIFEIIYLLHTNHPELQDWEFPVKKLASKGTSIESKKAQLYLEGAPHGVLGIKNLPDALEGEFLEYVKEAFDSKGVFPHKDELYAVVGLLLLSPLGTLAQDPQRNILNLMVLYTTESFFINAQNWNEKDFERMFHFLFNSWTSRMKVQLKASYPSLEGKGLERKARQSASNKLNQVYPMLYRQFVTKDVDYTQYFNEPPEAIKSPLLRELQILVKNFQKLELGAKEKKQVDLFKKRLQHIQTYISDKYPNLQISLTALQTEEFRLGKFQGIGNTRDFPGGVYTQLFPYENLMTGISLTSVVPTHFLLPPEINNDSEAFEKHVDHIRFQFSDFYRETQEWFVNHGPILDISSVQASKHSSILAWEAYQATLGYLPQALWNLLRYEMFLEPEKRLGRSMVQLLKNPSCCDSLLPSPHFLLEMEIEIPQLKLDPYWLRYKVLKIAFSKDHISQVSKEEQERISSTLDIIFAILIGLPHFFLKFAGSLTPTSSTTKDKVLQLFWNKVFPDRSRKRQEGRFLFLGEAKLLWHFNQEFRSIFQTTVERIQKKLQNLHQGKLEFTPKAQAWLHHFEENFEFDDTQIRRVPFPYLQNAKQCLQIGYQKKAGWFFRSLSKDVEETDKSGNPQVHSNITLLENTGFLRGLIHCVLNGYYGVWKKGTSEEHPTQLEFDEEHQKLRENTKLKMTLLEAEAINRLMTLIQTVFPPRKLQPDWGQDKKINKVFLFLNLVQYGRLSFLYDNNQGGLFLEEKDHPAIISNAQKIRMNSKAVLQSGLLFESIHGFMKNHELNTLGKVKLHVWVNPNSIDAHYPVNKVVQKEEDLAEAFTQEIQKALP